MDVGFVGLGTMGSRMARHLGEAQHRLALYDIDPSAAEHAAGLAPGARVLPSAKAVAAECGIVITMLPAGPQVREAALGPDGLTEGFAAGSLLVDCSSSEPWITVETAKALTDEGFAMIDAPVSGGREGAEAGTLTFMAGGEAEAVERARPLFEAMGKNVFHIGGPGAGHAMKAVNNLCGALTALGSTEALLIGRAFGIDPRVMADVINVSTGRSAFTQGNLPNHVLTRKFDAGFKMDLMIKDMGIALEMGERLGVPTQFASLGRQMWRAARTVLGPDQTVADLCRWLEQVAQVELTPVEP